MTGKTLTARPKPAAPPEPEAPPVAVGKGQNLQDQFLNLLRKNKTPVTMFLVNGFQLRGVITGFDCFVVVLDSEGRQQVIYKHAISTIAPARNVTLWEDAE